MRNNPSHKAIIRDSLDKWFHDCEEDDLKPTDLPIKPLFKEKGEKTQKQKDKGLKHE